MRFFSPSLVFSAALLLGFSGNVLIAQDQSQPTATAQTSQPHKAPNPNRQAKMMAKRLGLTPDQQSKIEPILADRDQQIQSARSDASLAPKDRRAKVQGIKQDSDSKIESVLSDTQKQQYEQMKQQHAHRQQGAQQPTGAPVL